MAVGSRRDPFLNFNFVVEVDGLVVGGFSDVSGLQVEVEVEAYREGGLNTYIHQFAGPAKYPSRLVLKRGLTDADVLWRWHRDVTLGKVERKSGSVKLRDSTGEVKIRWDFRGAYPVRWTGPEFSAGKAEVAVETLELVHNGLRMNVGE